MKTLLRVLIATVLAGNMASIICMELSKADVLYRQKCKKIDQKNDRKLHDFLQDACEISLGRAKQEIEDKIDRCERKIIKRQEDLFLIAKKKYNISDEQWNTGVKLAKQIDDFKKVPQSLLFDTTHDQKLPALFVALLKKELVINGLNPNMFNIIEKKTNIPFSSRGYGVSFYVEDDIFTIEMMEPGFIKISAEMASKMLSSYEAKEAFCAYIVSTIAAKKTHPLTILTGLNIIDVITNKEVDYLASTYEVTIMPFILGFALKYQRTAQLLKTYYVGILTSASLVFSQQELCDVLKFYKELCRINRFHKCLAWLKEYADVFG